MTAANNTFAFRSIPKISELPIARYSDLPKRERDCFEYPVSWSRLNRFIANPGYYKRNPDRKIDSDGFLLGSYLHTAALEPERLDERYYEFKAPINPKENKPYGEKTETFKEALEQAQAQAGPGQTAVPDYYREYWRTTDEIWRECGYWKYLEGMHEVLVVADSVVEGVSCQGRIDSYSEEYGIVDIKKTDKPLFCAEAESDFFRACKSYGYLYELSFFAMIVGEATGKTPPIGFLVVKAETPYETAYFPIARESQMRAEKKIREEFLPAWARYLRGEEDWGLKREFELNMKFERDFECAL